MGRDSDFVYKGAPQVSPYPGPLYAQAGGSIPLDELSCERVGKYCFDPQVGLYERSESEAKFVVEDDVIDAEESGPGIKNATGTNLIKCDKSKTMFDIFCGEGKPEKGDAPKEKKPAKIAFWIDVSNSLREVDFVYTDKSPHKAILEGASCFRERVVTEIERHCPKGGYEIMIFSTGIKLYTGGREVCGVVGGHPHDGGFPRWLAGSKQRLVVILTDIHEWNKLHKDVHNWISKMQWTSVGHGDKGALMTRQKMLNRVRAVAKAHCS